MFSLRACSTRLEVSSVMSTSRRIPSIRNPPRHRLGTHITDRLSLLSVASISSRKRPQVLCHRDVEEWPDVRVAFQDVRGRGPLYAKGLKLSYDREEALKQLDELWAHNQKLQDTLVRLWNQHQALECRLIETEKYLEYLEQGRGEDQLYA